MLKKLGEMKVQKRLKTAFRVAILTAAFSGILGAILLLSTDLQYSKALEENGFVQGDIGVMSTQIQKAAALTRDVIMLTDKAEIDAAYEEMNIASDRAVAMFAEVKKNCPSKEEKELLAKMEADLAPYKESRERAVELAMQNRNDEASEVFRTEARPYLLEITECAEKLMNLNAEMGDKVSNRMTVSSRVCLFIIIAIVLIAIQIGNMFSKYITKSLSEPINEMVRASKELAGGHMNIDLAIDTNDEMGEMAKDFKEAVANIQSYVVELDRVLKEVGKGNFTAKPEIEFQGDFVDIENALETIVADLSETMAQINEASEQVTIGSQQLADGAQSLAEGATDQAGAVEELTATIQNVAEQIAVGADGAIASYENAKKYAMDAESSREEMKHLLEAMSKISDTSQQIGNIITEIEDIASQTNLLSLNASIEAARAGEAGRGFAVVADQIGKLAADSAKSAVNTRSLIANALDEINRGNEMTETTAEKIEKVIVGMEEIAEASKETSEVAKEQAESMRQLELGVEQISSVVQTNSAAAEETSATSEELSAQAESLRGLVEHFKLRV